MYAQNVKDLFIESVSGITNNIEKYSVHPGKDLTRKRKLPAEKVITFLVSEGSSSTRIELLDFFNMDSARPTASALNQQRAKLKPEAFEVVFRNFNDAIEAQSSKSGYRLIAVDGSTLTFPGKPSLTPTQYHVSEGHSAKGFYSIHLNAFYDLDSRCYVDAFLQPVHEKDEFRAFCSMADRYHDPLDRKAIFIGDRGYASYNNMAHAIEKGQFFLFRAKDILSKGITAGFNLPNDDEFDVDITVTLTRSHSKKLPSVVGYKRFVDKNTSFDFIEYGSLDTYTLSFRVIRFPISEGNYECLLTNLPRKEFPFESIKRLYFSRWGIETSFRELKYTIGLSNFHSSKPDYVQQEIWARLIAYNITETIISQVVLPASNTKFTYKVNFSIAAHACRKFVYSSVCSFDILGILKRELIPIRDERQFQRLHTAHFRKPRHFIYRAS